jgi:hypothetical protein
MRPEDFAHAASADFFQDSIMSHPLADHKRLLKDL